MKLNLETEILEVLRALTQLQVKVWIQPAPCIGLNTTSSRYRFEYNHLQVSDFIQPAPEYNSSSMYRIEYNQLQV